MTSATAAVDDETVTLVYDTHFDGRFGDDDEPNIARYATAVSDLLEEHDNAVFVGGGDDLSPSVLSLVYEGEHMVPALNKLDPVVNGVSHHDFDFGADIAADRFEDSEFPWVNAQLLTDDGEPVPGTERWTTVDVGEFTIGFFSLAREDFTSTTDYPDDWQVLGQTEAAEEAVAALDDEGADLIVCAGRVPQGDKFDVPTEVAGVDAFVGSSGDVDGIDDLPDDVVDETPEPPTIIDGSVVSRVGKEFGYLGALTFDAAGELVDYELVEVTTDIEPDAGMEAIVEEWRGDLEDEYGHPFFETDVPLDVRVDTNYGTESAFGNLATDAMREYADADLAILNPGGIRTNDVYGPGEIDGLDVLNILPFPNRLVVAEVTGETIIEYLSSQVSALPWSSFGAQPGKQVSGVQYEWRGHDGDAVAENFYVGDEPLDPEETYELATLDFLLGARDVLADAEVVSESDEFVGQIVLDALEEAGQVSPRTDERMLRVDEDVGESRDVDRTRGQLTFVFDAPVTAVDVVPETFVAVTQTGVVAEAVDVALDEEAAELRVAFDRTDTGALTSAANRPDTDLRIFGDYEPDDEAFGYEDDGDSLELPVAAAIDAYRLKGTVDGL
ncbi:bifunctional metallophosphatase/5'-nucleotidase [Natronococcus pandeyae]|uniref:Bifunctional metallophosphatase/5'-nucleotidase n=1 Tax=Natronococcus pandeyae TaxID=2055836 RepID=A0A8J8TQR9_9EURY|nr:bifunctional metallophosphatase/5'-nucleotidase [Natronococcus pandeyae]